MSKKKFTGQVIAVKMKNTVSVEIDVSDKHPIYGKSIKKTKTFLARVKEDFSVGDTVTIQECRPLSKKVTWEVIGKLGDKGEK